MDTTNTKTEALIRQQEQQILQFENQEGITNLVRFADSNEDITTFIPKYQSLIRNNIWPYSDEFIPTYNGLVHRFHQTSLSYVANAMSLYPLLRSTNADDIYMAFEIAVFSEAARGREGKRSKIGLDRQHDILEAELLNLLRNVWVSELGDVNESLNVIAQTILSGPSSSEESQEMYLKCLNTYDGEISISNLEDVSINTEGTAKALIRNFCCYSLEKLNRQLGQYRAVYAKLKAKSTMIATKRAEKISLTSKIANRIESMGSSSKRFFQLIQQIDHLNFLNDNVDVKYSFKSWPGLIHWNAFDKAMKYTGTTSSISAIAEAFLIKH